MFREIPVSNRFLSKKWERIDSNRLNKVIKNIRPAIDASSPSNFPKERLNHETWREGSPQAERRLQILTDNKKILKKMSAIQTKTTSFDISSVSKSLNQGRRNRQAKEIKAQNEALVKRLKEKQSFYQAKAWAEERKANEKLLRVICQYPYRLGSRLSLIHI